MSQTVIGLDIGTYSVKVAILESGLRKLDLVDWKQARVALDGHGQPVSADLAEAVRVVLDGVKERNAIVTAVPGSRVLSRELSLPFADPKKIQSVLEFELDGQFPLPVEDLVYDYVILEQGDSGAELLCSAVDQQFLATFVSDLSDAGADPKIVCVDMLAVADLVPQLSALGGEEVEEGEAIALLDMGHSSTSLTVVRDERVEMMHPIKKGGLHLTRALMSTLALDYVAAEDVKHNGVTLDETLPVGVSPEVHLLRKQAIERALTPLLRDLRLSLHAHASRFGSGVRRVVLFGGTSRLPGLAPYLEKALNVSVEQPRFGALPWVKAQLSRDNDCVLPTSASLGLRFRRDSEEKSVNFRRGSLAFKSDSGVFGGRSAWLAIMLVLLIGAFFGRMMVHKGTLENDQNKLVAALNTYTDAAFGKRKDEFLEGKKPTFKGVLAKVGSLPKEASVEVMPKQTALHVMHRVAQAIHQVNGMMKEADDEDAELSEDKTDKEKAAALLAKKAYKIELAQLEVNNKTAFIKGVYEPFEAYSALKVALQKDPCFEPGEGQTKDSRSVGGFGKGFTLTVKLLCSDPKLNQKSEKKTRGAKTDRKRKNGGK